MMDQMGAVLPDIPRLFTALAEWLACVLCILEMKKRFVGWRLVGIAGVSLVIQGTFLELTKDVKGIWWMLCMVAALGMMYLFIWICCDAGIRDVGYCVARAFVVAEFAASLEWQIDCFFYQMFGWLHPAFHILCLVVVYGIVYTIIGCLFQRYAIAEDLLVTDREVISSTIIGLAVFLTSNLGFIPVKTPFSGRYSAEVFNVRTLIDMGGVATLYAYHVQRMDFRVRRELERVQNILNNQYVQYKQSREAVDMINYKYHDLKHHIIALRAEENAQKRNEYLDKMEEEIQNYEAQNKTGNKVLDTMLTMKGLYCLNHDISLTSVVDGTLFGFMDAMDICSIFGNALDNAIECEVQIPEKEKRMIHVSTFSKRNFLIIRFENYCETNIDLRTGFPETTKADTRFHGYGLKSLRYTVKKYGGEVNVTMQDNWFNLKILIPMEM